MSYFSRQTFTKVCYLLVLWTTLVQGNCYDDADAAAVHQIYQFPNRPFTDIENVGARPNGQLLLNTINSPTTYLLDPDQVGASPVLIHTYPNASSTLGITEIQPDVFAIVVGNYSTSTKTGIKGSFTIWTLDLQNGEPGIATQATSIPEAEALNGATLVPGTKNLILVADSSLGAVWSVNVSSGAYTLAIQSSEFDPDTFPLGINGVHTRGMTLYFTDSAKNIYGSIPITRQGSAAGPVSIIAHAPAYAEAYDDFTFDSSGNAFITGHPNAVFKVTPSGAQSLLARNDFVFDQPTSAVFGRRSPGQESTLYVVTGGDASRPASGQVIAIETS